MTARAERPSRGAPVAPDLVIAASVQGTDRETPSSGTRKGHRPGPHRCCRPPRAAHGRPPRCLPGAIPRASSMRDGGVASRGSGQRRCPQPWRRQNRPWCAHRSRRRADEPPWSIVRRARPSLPFARSRPNGEDAAPQAAPQAESSARPLRRRAARIARPARVLMRRRKPWVLARRRLFGWKVRLLTSNSKEVGEYYLPRAGDSHEVVPQH